MPVKPPVVRPRPKQQIVTYKGFVEALRKAITGHLIITTDPQMPASDIDPQILQANPIYLSWPGSNVNYFVLGYSSFDPDDGDAADWILG